MIGTASFRVVTWIRFGRIMIRTTLGAGARETKKEGKERGRGEGRKGEGGRGPRGG